jgi:hypothetical protein
MIWNPHRRNVNQVTKEIVKWILLKQFRRYHDNDYEYRWNPNEEIQIDNLNEWLLEEQVHLLHHRL